MSLLPQQVQVPHDTSIRAALPCLELGAQAMGCRQSSSLPVLIAAAWRRGTNEKTGLDLEPS